MTDEQIIDGSFGDGEIIESLDVNVPLKPKPKPEPEPEPEPEFTASHRRWVSDGFR